MVGCGKAFVRLVPKTKGVGVPSITELIAVANEVIEDLAVGIRG